ncbi:molybdopterin oxidoreductase [Hapalosiphon sp. MRB220]|nr:molybdopterin oxidoreductase [Hapalosiphon sp. MRB220]
MRILHHSEQDLADAFKTIANHHSDEPDVYNMCKLLSSWSDEHVQDIKPLVDRYSEQESNEPDRLTQTLFEEPRSGSLALVRDLHDLWLLANEIHLCYIILLQAARALRDLEMEKICQQFDQQIERQMLWLLTRIKQAAPQALVVAA